MGKIRNLVVIVLGICGLSAFAAPKKGAAILKEKLQVSNVSFHESPQSPQDFTAGK